jgi:hypothetical protein
MTLNEMLVVGLLLLTIVCCSYVQIVALRRRSTREQLPTLSEYLRDSGEHWRYERPAPQNDKQYWSKNPPDLKDPIDGRD